MKKRYVLEGIWSGYRSNQSKLCHVQIIKNPEIYNNLKSILFTDNTYLYLKTREVTHREKIKENLQYYDLINQCLRENENIVANLKD